MSTSAPFSRLVRFQNKSGKILYGEFTGRATPSVSEIEGATVNVYEGDAPWTPNFKLGSGTDVVAKVLSPIPEVPIFYGIGLNYRQHAEEAKFPIPKYPVVFNKPSHALAGPDEDIPIHSEAKWMDYEGELSVVIGKECKNLTESDDPFEYVIGYTVGNDVSARWWQHPDQCGNQHGYAKSFDKFAPLGPLLVSKSQILDPSKLVLKTFVNGEERQRSGLDDLIFDIGTIIRFLSTGRTLTPGMVIMSGTPSGVAAFMKDQPWIKNGDVVEVEISGIGRIKNKYVY